MQRETGVSLVMRSAGWKAYATLKAHAAFAAVFSAMPALRAVAAMATRLRIRLAFADRFAGRSQAQTERETESGEEGFHWLK